MVAALTPVSICILMEKAFTYKGWTMAWEMHTEYCCCAASQEVCMALDDNLPLATLDEILQQGERPHRFHGRMHMAHGIQALAGPEKEECACTSICIDMHTYKRIFA
jgi:hypothetical protein